MATLPEGFEVESQSQGLTLPEGFEVESTSNVPSVLEAPLAVGSAIAGTVAGGLAGTVQALNPFAAEGAGAEAVASIQDAFSFQPQTEEGKADLKIFTDLVQKGVDIANFPLSGLAGIVELVKGEGIDQAVETIKNVQDQGISKTAGERVFEETGSPLAATVAETAPTAVLSAIGLGGAPRATQAIKETAKSAGTALKPVVQGSKELAKGVFEFQSPTKQRIAKLLQEGSVDVETARFALAPSTLQKVPSAQQAPITLPKKIQEFLDIGGPKVKTDKLAVNTINQGFDEGVIAAIKGSSPIDQTKLLEMVNIMEKGKKNALFAAKNRPGDVAGGTLIDTFNDVLRANRDSGRELQGVANKLKGQVVDFDPAINGFLEDLRGMGVNLSDDLKPIFSGSDIEGVTNAESIINKVVNRMKSIKNPDGFNIHRLKKFIDEQVTFGKSAEGLSGKSEVIVKKLRRNLDKILDDKFPEYDRVNTTFSKTIEALDTLQDASGKKLNLSGANADKATGTLLRRMMSNTQGRVNLIDSIDLIEEASKQFGGGSLPKIEGAVPKQLSGKSDLLTQILFADELDRVFGPVARTSFQGQIDQALKQGVNAATTRAGAVDAALSVAGKVAEKAKGINEPNAFKSIKELLEQGNK